VSFDDSFVIGRRAQRLAGPNGSPAEAIEQMRQILRRDARAIVGISKTTCFRCRAAPTFLHSRELDRVAEQVAEDLCESPAIGANEECRIWRLDVMRSPFRGQMSHALFGLRENAETASPRPSDRRPDSI
jgi:hypothetical protein